MTNQNQDEKFDEKEREKSDEKAPGEKWRRDPLSGAIWALILIWAGLVLLASELELFDRLPRFTFDLGAERITAQLDPWGLILIGAGIIILVEVFLRQTVASYRRPVGGSIFLAILFLGMGLGNILSWDFAWPIVLIFIGLAILVGGLFRRR